MMKMFWWTTSKKYYIKLHILTFDEVYWVEIIDENNAVRLLWNKAGQIDFSAKRVPADAT